MVVSNSPTPRARGPRVTARRSGTSRPRSGCRPTSPPWSPASTTRSTTSTSARTARSRSATSAASRCRTHLDHEELNQITKQGFEFFEDAFDYPYPFGKYDQAYVPEYNMGAMENAGCVTFRDEYLPRSRQVHAFYEGRANTMLHEMAHMWFGDLVTMSWWDDLWLNESFAEWASHHAMVKATEFTEAWTGLHQRPQELGLPPGPAALDPPDRGRQLRPRRPSRSTSTASPTPRAPRPSSSWSPGWAMEEFLAGLRDYFQAHAFANSEFSDLLAPSRRRRVASCRAWAEEWLQTSGVNTLSPTSRSTRTGRTSLASRSPRRRHRSSRPSGGTASAIGLYDLHRIGAGAPLGVARDRHRRRLTEIAAAGGRATSPTCCCSTTAT